MFMTDYMYMWLNNMHVDQTIVYFSVHRKAQIYHDLSIHRLYDYNANNK